jgi:hypothetical protein
MAREIVSETCTKNLDLKRHRKDAHEGMASHSFDASSVSLLFYDNVQYAITPSPQ